MKERSSYLLFSFEFVQAKTDANIRNDKIVSGTNADCSCRFVRFSAGFIIIEKPG